MRIAAFGFNNKNCVFGFLNMMLALQKVMVMTCGRWLKSAIKLALKDDCAEYTKPANSAKPVVTFDDRPVKYLLNYFFSRLFTEGHCQMPL
jgi:hypothetical protein